VTLNRSWFVGGSNSEEDGAITTYEADNRPIQASSRRTGLSGAPPAPPYTPSGKAATATDANGNATRYSYDVLDRQATTVDALGRTAQFT